MQCCVWCAGDHLTLLNAHHAYTHNAEGRVSCSDGHQKSPCVAAWGAQATT